MQSFLKALLQRFRATLREVMRDALSDVAEDAETSIKALINGRADLSGEQKRVAREAAVLALGCLAEKLQARFDE